MTEWKLGQLPKFVAKLRPSDEVAVEVTGNTRLFHDAVAPHVKRAVAVNPNQFQVILHLTCRGNTADYPGDPSSQPVPEDSRLTCYKERPEDHLVVPGDPRRKENIEIIRVVIRVPSRYVGKGTPAAIDRQRREFNKDNPRQRQRPVKAAQNPGHGKHEDRSGKDRPDDRVHKSDDQQLHTQSA